MAQFPPVFPPKPDIYNAVDLGPLPTREDYEQAYNAWKLPYDTLAVGSDTDHVDRDDPHQKDKDLLEILVFHIINSFRRDPQSIPDPNPDAQKRWPDPDENISLSDAGWLSSDFLYLHAPSKPFTKADVRINGKEIKSLDKKRKAEVLDLLVDRGFDRNVSERWTKKVMVTELVDHEVNAANQLNPSTHLRELFVSSPLTAWGGTQSRCLIRHSSDHVYMPWEMYTIALYLSPYNPTYWAARSYLYYQQGHYDQALGDAYRGLRLAQTVYDVNHRAKQPGLYSRVWDAIEQHVVIHGRKDYTVKEQLTKDQGVPYFVTAVRKTCHHIIAQSLSACSAFRDAHFMDDYLVKRQVMSNEDRVIFQQRAKELELKAEHWEVDRMEEAELNGYERRLGRLNWKESAQEQRIDAPLNGISQKMSNLFSMGSERSSKVTVRYADQDLDQSCTLRQMRDNRVRVTAREDFEAGEVILVEEPSVRGYLRPSKQIWSEKWLCGNCAKAITVEHRRTISEAVQGTAAQERDEAIAAMASRTGVCLCVNQEDGPLFCSAVSNGAQASRAQGDGRGSQSRSKKRGAPSDEDDDQQPEPKLQRTGMQTRAATAKATRQQQVQPQPQPQPQPQTQTSLTPNALSCLEIARARWHYRACGRDWDWLQCSMRRYTAQFAGLKESVDCGTEHGAILSLLLRDVFDMTLRARDAKTRKPGDEHTVAHEVQAMFFLPSGLAERARPDVPFPFGWAANIVIPFDILENLGVNIYRDLGFDTWIIQAVLRKLLVNAVPWIDEPTHGRNLDLFPEFLHIFPAFAQLRHDCRAAENAKWYYYPAAEDEAAAAAAGDVAPRNQLMVVAKRDIKAGEEIRIRYHRYSEPETIRRTALWYLSGRDCDCSECQAREVGQDVEQDEQQTEGSAEGSAEDSTEEPMGELTEEMMGDPGEEARWSPMEETREGPSEEPDDEPDEEAIEQPNEEMSLDSSEL